MLALQLFKCHSHSSFIRFTIGLKFVGSKKKINININSELLSYFLWKDLAMGRHWSVSYCLLCTFLITGSNSSLVLQVLCLLFLERCVRGKAEHPHLMVTLMRISPYVTWYFKDKYVNKLSLLIISEKNNPSSHIFFSLCFFVSMLDEWNFVNWVKPWGCLLSGLMADTTILGPSYLESNNDSWLHFVWYWTNCWTFLYLWLFPSVKWR